jgi:uncharacterized membrane protein YjgN (DUF898 family)
MRTFKSKQDIWLIAIIYSSIVISLAACVALLYAGMTTFNISMVVFILLVGVMWPFILVHSLRYDVDETHLIIKNWPFKWVVPLADITEVKATRDATSSPALSLDRLGIRYGTFKYVMVSPLDKAAFLDALKVQSKAKFE